MGLYKIIYEQIIEFDRFSQEPEKLAKHDETTAPEDIQDFLMQTKMRNGFIPNLHGIMAEAPGLLEGYRAINDLFLKSSFNRDEITVIWQSVNVENNCHYCVPAHTMVAKGNETPLANVKLEALRTFTLQVARQHGVVDDNDVQAFLDAGYTKRNILEVILGLSQKACQHTSGCSIQISGLGEKSLSRR